MKCIYFQVRLPRRRDLRQGGRHDVLPGQLDAGVDANGDQHDGGVVVIAVSPSKQPQQLVFIQQLFRRTPSGPAPATPAHQPAPGGSGRCRRRRLHEQPASQFEDSKCSSSQAVWLSQFYHDGAQISEDLPVDICCWSDLSCWEWTKKRHVLYIDRK